jgi:DNA-nicking Smr family endonuclease
LAVDSDVQAFYCNEYVEGGPRRWDQVLLKKLREGSFSVQAELDLHGLNQAEALTTVESFLVDCCRRKLGCVRIVHGRGNNSPGYVPVLKSRLERWLSLRRTSRYVVAYTSARPADGGAGAMYVLLRVRR